jgi:ribosomal protein S18 acetylase RimI-like enzyme
MKSPRYEVRTEEDEAVVLDATSTFLASRPVDHNVVATVLTDVAPYTGVGRYWWVSDGDQVAAVAISVPAGHRAALTAVSTHAVDALGDAMAEDQAELPGVVGEAGAASRFAGRWAERRRLPVDPVEGGRLYRLGDLAAPPPVPGALRRATPADEDLVALWAAGFRAETGDEADTVVNARHRLAAGRLWLWEDGEPVAMASAPAAVYGVARVGVVYTPPDRRGRGYAAGVVAALSEHLLSGEADTCILYTQLSNPTSNAIYQRLGYQAVAEILTYRFRQPE